MAAPNTCARMQLTQIGYMSLKYFSKEIMQKSCHLQPCIFIQKRCKSNVNRNTFVSRKLCPVSLLINGQKSSTKCSKSLQSRLCSSKSPASAPSEPKGPISWKTLVIVAGLGIVVAFFVQREIRKKEKKIQKIETIGKIQVGGPWEGLVDQKGAKKSSEDFQGQWLYLYFGFTHCPDVCPDEMEKIIRATTIIDDNPDAPNITPLFISIDPHRDTPEVVGKYIEEFSPKMIGLTGSKEAVARVARLYRVYSSEGPRDEDEDYIVDHSIITFLINPLGECVTFFTKNSSDSQMAATTMLQMKEWAINK